MVDDIDNHVDVSRGKGVDGWRLALLLLQGFRTHVDEVHALLSERGHPGVRPSSGFALQAIGDGAGVSAMARRLGVSKQAASKTVAVLERQGYVARSTDPADGRRLLVVPTARGRELLALSVQAFDEVLQGWSARVGADAVQDLHDVLAQLVGGTPVRLDLAGWSG